MIVLIMRALVILPMVTLINGGTLSQRQLKKVVLKKREDTVTVDCDWHYIQTSQTSKNK